MAVKKGECGRWMVWRLSNDKQSLPSESCRVVKAVVAWLSNGGKDRCRSCVSKVTWVAGLAYAYHSKSFKGTAVNSEGGQSRSSDAIGSNTVREGNVESCIGCG